MRVREAKWNVKKNTDAFKYISIVLHSDIDADIIIVKL